MNDSVQELTNKIFRYCELFDTGDFEAFAEQFTHGRWFVADPGPEGVLAFIRDVVLTYDGLPRTKHVTTNLAIEVDDDDKHATASSYITVFQAVDDLPLQPIFMGRYKDIFEKIDGEWRWLERNVIPDLYGDTSRHTRPRPKGTNQ